MTGWSAEKTEGCSEGRRFDGVEGTAMDIARCQTCVRNVMFGRVILVQAHHIKLLEKLEIVVFALE